MTGERAEAPNGLLVRVLSPAAAPARSLAGVRVAAGLVFVAAGLVKLLFENQGAIRFTKIGLSPGLATFVSLVEIAAGVLWIAGLLVRPAALALAVDMVCAVAITKLPYLSGAGVEPLGADPKIGFWAFAYQARLDLLLLAIAIALVTSGAGPGSLDARLAQRLVRER